MVDRVLNGLQWAIAACVFVLFSLGRGAHGVFIAILIALPVLRFLFSKSYRQRVTRFLQEEWRTLLAPRTASFRSAFIFIVIPALFLNLVNGISISSFDNYGVMMTAASLWTDGDMEISEYTPAPRKFGRNFCKEGLPGYYYMGCSGDGVRALYPIGMLVPLTPVYGLAHVLGADVTDATVQWRLAKWTASLVAALSMLLFFFIGRHWVSAKAAYFVTWLLMVGSAVFSIVSQGTWSHDGVFLSTLLFLFFETLRSNRKESWSKHVLYGCLYGFLFAWAFSSRLSSVVLLIPCGFLLLGSRGIKGTLCTGIATVAWYLPLAFYYSRIYGNIFGPQMLMGMTHGVSHQSLSVLPAMLFSPLHGLLVYQPWIFLLALYLLPSVRTFTKEHLKTPKASLLMVLAIFAIVSQIIIVSLWPIWWGGTWGSRLLTETLISFGFLVLFPVQYLYTIKKVSIQRGLIALLLVSSLMHIPHVYLFAGQWYDNPIPGDKRTYSEKIWDWWDPPFLYPLRLYRK